MTTDEHYAVVAELPLGVYRGRLADGGIDPVPAPARLHGALLQAAAQGPRAVVHDGALGPRREDLAALRWLEAHPPDGVHVPPIRTTAAIGGATIVYRFEGTLKKEGRMAGPGEKKSAKPFAGVVAVNGPFAWTWSAPPPPEVQLSLESLVGDVSHLGNSESPARVRVGTARPTHRLMEHASVFDAPVAGRDLDVALPGRAEALIDLYDAGQRPPTLAQDRYATSEEPRSRPGWPVARGLARYVEQDAAPVVEAPWNVVLVAGLRGAPVGDDERVAVAVAAHRALIRAVGYGAPPLLTGAYHEGTKRPANRVALHVLPARSASEAGLDADSDHLLVMLPRDVQPVDVAIVSQAFDAITRVGGRKLGRRSTRLGGSFWSPLHSGVGRVWATDPVAIPETRPPRVGGWDLADVVGLSVALVFRDHPGPGPAGPPLFPAVAGRGQERYRALADRAASLGVQVHRADFLRTSEVGAYVHKTPEQGIVRPYRAVLSLGQVGGASSLLALGQSRHLGGGLLVPAWTAER